MTSVPAGHIILTPTQPVKSGRPWRESNPGPPYQKSRALPTGLRRPRESKKEKERERGEERERDRGKEREGDRETEREIKWGDLLIISFVIFYTCSLMSPRFLVEMNPIYRNTAH